LPYAHYAWSRLAGFANRKNYKRVFDIASSTFYNRHLFDARWYIGGDISESKLRKGISDYTEDKSIACLTNIADLAMIESLADLIVCTYTLIFIPPSAREVIIQRLILMTAAGGDLFVEMPRSGPAPQIRLLLQQNFQEVCVTYFNSPMSCFYQRTLGRRVKHDHVLVRIMVIGLTFLFERLYPNISFGNRNVLALAKGKKAGIKKAKQPEGHQIYRYDYRLLHDGRCPLLRTYTYDDDRAGLNQCLIGQSTPHQQ